MKTRLPHQSGSIGWLLVVWFSLVLGAAWRTPAASLPGTIVAAPIVPGGDDANTYSIGDTTWMQGTDKQVPDIATRDLISALRRSEGMTCFVINEQNEYRLVGGTNNANWVLWSASTNAFSVNVFTNNGSYVFLYGTTATNDTPFLFGLDGEFLFGTNVLTAGLAPGYHAFAQVSFTDSNQPAVQFFDMLASKNTNMAQYGNVNGSVHENPAAAVWSVRSGDPITTTNVTTIQALNASDRFLTTSNGVTIAQIDFAGNLFAQSLGGSNGTPGMVAAFQGGNVIGPTNVLGYGLATTNYVHDATNGLAGGSVTSVGITGPDGVSWANTPVTGAGVLTGTTPGLLMTNGESVAVTFSNSVTMNAGGTSNWVSTMVVSNLTASTVVAADANKYLSSVANAAGALTNNGTGTLGFYNSFATQPGNNVMSGSNYVSGSITTSTNSCNGVPDFSVIESLFSTNNAVIFAAPTGIDSTKKTVQWLLVNVTNTTAAAVSITAPANCHLTGTAYVTNLTWCWFQCYGGAYTNLACVPVF